MSNRTGKPRMTRTCKGPCGSTLPLEAFPTHGHRLVDGTLGRRHTCAKCTSETAKAKRAGNLDACRLQARVYWQQNRERLSEYRKVRYRAKKSDLTKRGRVADNATATSVRVSRP